MRKQETNTPVFFVFKLSQLAQGKKGYFISLSSNVTGLEILASGVLLGFLSSIGPCVVSKWKSKCLVSCIIREWHGGGGGWGSVTGAVFFSNSCSFALLQSCIVKYDGLQYSIFSFFDSSNSLSEMHFLVDLFSCFHPHVSIHLPLSFEGQSSSRDSM